MRDLLGHSSTSTATFSASQYVNAVITTAHCRCYILPTHPSPGYSRRLHGVERYIYLAPILRRAEEDFLTTRSHIHTIRRLVLFYNMIGNSSDEGFYDHPYLLLLRHGTPQALFPLTENVRSIPSFQSTLKTLIESRSVLQRI